MRRALIRRSNIGIQRSRTTSLPAPVGGWNTVAPLSSMPPQDAVTLDNWFPRPAEVQVRPGCVNHATGMSPVLTAMAWNGPATSKMFGVTSSSIFNTTGSGAPGTADLAVTNGYLQWTNFSNVAGAWLIAVNGSDPVMLYNGTTWQQITGVSTPAITGLATSQLSNVTVAKSRLWFCANASMSAWYLPAGAIAGALSEFPLGGQFLRGGYLVGITNWTVDGGDGSDDYTVFISSEGEVAVYKGTDPDSASTWNKVGTYYIGAPIGAKCFCKYGGDVLVLCQNGLFPLSKALQSATINRQSALTSKIDSAFAEATGLYGHVRGWQALSFPQVSLLLVNIPHSGNESEQFVMNTITGAWCRFTGWNARCWLGFDTELYFGHASGVAEAWTGASDFGNEIACKAQQAFNYFGTKGQQKRINLLRPVLTIDGAVDIKVSIDTDFILSDYSSSNFVSSVSSVPWDTAVWGTDLWASGGQLSRQWMTTFANDFYAAAIRLQCNSSSASLRWSATDAVYELGGVL